MSVSLPYSHTPGQVGRLMILSAPITSLTIASDVRVLTKRHLLWSHELARLTPSAVCGAGTAAMSLRAARAGRPRCTAFARHGCAQTAAAACYCLPHQSNLGGEAPLELQLCSVLPKHHARVQAGLPRCRVVVGRTMPRNGTGGRTTTPWYSATTWTIKPDLTGDCIAAVERSLRRLMLCQTLTDVCQGLWQSQ